MAALVLTIAVSAFTLRPPVYYFCSYNGRTEKNPGSFTIQSTQPAHLFNKLSPPQLNWFRVEDVDVSCTISAAEFDASFEIYDVQTDANNLLKDEHADISGQLDLIHLE